MAQHDTLVFYTNIAAARGELCTPSVPLTLPYSIQKQTQHSTESDGRSWNNKLQIGMRKREGKDLNRHLLYFICQNQDFLNGLLFIVISQL